MVKNPKVDSALHVIKGAVEKVTGATVTSAVGADRNLGRLTVEFERDLREDEKKKIEELCYLYTNFWDATLEARLLLLSGGTCASRHLSDSL